MFQDISIDDLIVLKNKGELTVIDVRSPSEYKDATIPGSINIPFFNDEERAEVGTIYKQVSPQAAKDRGLEIVSAKLPDFIKKFRKLEGNKAVFCWRGGMRSRTTATVLALMGIKAFRLDGGYRSFRHWVVDKLENTEWRKEAIVLNGYTGSGKTLILQQLHEAGYPVIDFEGLANHRGSNFGQIGLDPNNQKKFDGLLIEDLIRLKDSSYVLFEGESRRIGKVALPNFIMEMKDKGTQLIIEMPIEERMIHILDDYHPWEHQEECIEAFARVKKRIHTPIAAQIESDLKSGNFSEAVGLLLEYYYDPLYDHTAMQIPADQKIRIKADNIDEAVESLKKYLDVKQQTKQI
ncbi:tRNA 2-selenouridine(34) synthase MnmH [Oceanobacillus arenosus]|uniref:tRNA 2-selenouridine(34) synthase MnmH n=1 Tax=Oceanobacillus arenosus TaxID=1229153 RepID=A0A3D8PZX9_9BACI|nr:tRNA 2-selenouridine(34) synthase MnmH [Oceanobacillus arenosus]RDW21352.1 tRNA 2-selenouridine(34) synthase MnmH [Oceanobacillus arenosus]